MARTFLLALICTLTLTASAQPTWRFHLAFEDGTGARDTIWMVYDITATTGTFPYPGPNVDTLLGEGPVMVNDGLFHVFLTNALGDTTRTNAYPYSVYPSFDGTIIDAIHWIPPMTISWDTALFHASYLPYAQGSFGVAFMDGIAFSQFDTGLGFGQFNMLTNDSVTIDFLSDYLFQIPVIFGPSDDTRILETSAVNGGLHIWPNPVHDKVWIAPSYGTMKAISICDIAGRLIFHQDNLMSSELINTSA
ncbi:MAG: hypothetical protein WAT41_04125, partial [Flavobacteriales bacterium]